MQYSQGTALCTTGWAGAAAGTEDTQNWRRAALGEDTRKRNEPDLLVNSGWPRARTSPDEQELGGGQLALT